MADVNLSDLLTFQDVTDSNEKLLEIHEAPS